MQTAVGVPAGTGDVVVSAQVSSAVQTLPLHFPNVVSHVAQVMQVAPPARVLVPQSALHIATVAMSQYAPAPQKPSPDVTLWHGAHFVEMQTYPVTGQASAAPVPVQALA